MEDNLMTVYLNGKAYEASPGETVLQVALRNNIYIPHLCFHEKTGQAAKCRACVVEIEGMPGLKTACNTPVTEGMQASTLTRKVLDAQKLVVDLILSSGQHDCLSCEQNGNCELQDAAYYLGIKKPSFQLYDDEYEIDDSSEFIIVDRSKCINCGRCVVGCNQTVVNEVINFGNRGFETKIVFDTDLPMGTSTCVQCGECVQLCPVGCLIDKRALGAGRTWELDKVETVCPYCGVGCRIEVHVDRTQDKIVRITGVEDSPTNNGMLCVKGRYGFDFVNSEERITSPLIKDKGKFREASWEEAIELIAKKFISIKEEYGSDAIAGLASAKVTNEENFVFQKLIRKEVGTNNVDHCARL
jgi:predicted molibdopterin-dependent oxidoreductase YjgC